MLDNERDNMTDTIEGIDPWKVNAQLLAALIAARPHIGVGYSAMQRYEITKQVDAAIAAAKGE